MYMRNIRDWRDSTLMLSFEEKGYFDELLNLIYIYDDCLPDDDNLICRAMPVNKKIHNRLKQKLFKAGLIEIKDGFYFSKRASQEINKINEISSKNKVKAQNRWAKSLKNNNSAIAGAMKIEDAAALVKGNRERDSDRESKSENLQFKKTIAKNKLTQKRTKNDTKKSSYRKCSLQQVLDPEAEIPADYREYASGQGLFNSERVFWDWANWWVSENGQKAGKDGWFQTWKARVRKDVERQNSPNRNHNGPRGDRACTTTLGAQMALDRRRNRQ